MASIRRPIALSAAVALVSLLALALLLGRAEGQAAAKCVSGSERTGCKLASGASYFANQKVVGPTGYVTAQVSESGFAVAMHADIDCKTSNPAKRRQSRVESGWSSKRQPRVGKTYVIRKREADRGVTTSTKLTVAFKSAKRAVITIHRISKSGGKITCDGSKGWRLKRS